MRLRRAAACAASAGGTGAALAVGGHHAVDDAAILKPGQCQIETWAAQERAGPQLVHAGSGCRVGPVELSAAAKRSRRPAWQLDLSRARQLGGGLALWTAGATWQFGR